MVIMQMGMCSIQTKDYLKLNNRCYASRRIENVRRKYLIFNSGSLYASQLRCSSKHVDKKTFLHFIISHSVFSPGFTRRAWNRKPTICTNNNDTKILISLKRWQDKKTYYAECVRENKKKILREGYTRMIKKEG